MAKQKQKKEQRPNTAIAFHGGNEKAQAVYRRVMDYAHAHDLFAWQVIAEGLDALEREKELAGVSLSEYILDAEGVEKKSE